MANVFQVSRYFDSAGTRERGKRLYEELEKWARQEEGPLIVSFDDVEFVSLAFLDETVLRVLRERPGELDDRVSIQGLKPLAGERLRANLEKLGISPDIVIGKRAPEYA